MAKDLWYRWLESRAQPPIEGNEIYNEDSEYPAYYLSEKDMMRWLTSFSPSELLKEPDPRGYFSGEYATSGFNKRPMPYDTFPDVAVMNQGLGEQAPWASLYPVQQLGPNAAQGVYAHELGHFRDMRPNPYKMWSFPNHGFMTWSGLSGGLLQREFPAMVAEEDFWREKNGY